MTIMIHAALALAALSLTAQPAQGGYTAKQAVNALGDIHLAAAGVKACGRGNEKIRAANIDKLWPRVQAVSDTFRKAFGSEIPAEFKPKHTAECSSQIRYEDQLSFKIDLAERGAKKLAAQ